MHLTKGRLDAAEYTGNGTEKCILWDDQVSGFGCRIYPSGKKSFVLFYRFAGRQRFMTIGPYGALTLQTARDEAKKAIGKVLSGLDPLGERQDRARADTLAELCEAYLERHARVHKRSARDDERRINKTIAPALGSRKAAMVSRADISALHHQVGKTHPYEANRVLSLISKILECGRSWGSLPENFANPARGIKKFREVKRDRWVTQEEMPRLATAIQAEENIYIRTALWLYLLTGVRKSELLQARWANIDSVNHCLYLPRTKADRPHRVPLSRPALELLAALPRLEGNEFLFPGRRHGKHLVNISKPWVRVRAAAALGDVRLHDLRRTVGSWLAQKGADIHLIAGTLNHSQLPTTQGYAWHGLDPIRQALEGHATAVLDVAGRPGLTTRLVPEVGQKVRGE